MNWPLSATENAEIHDLNSSCERGTEHDTSKSPNFGAYHVLKIYQNCVSNRMCYRFFSSLQKSAKVLRPRSKISALFQTRVLVKRNIDSVT